MEATYNAAAWLVDRHVDAGDGKRLAVVCGQERLTYQDVLHDVWRAQHALRALDVRTGERVAMVVNDEPGFLAWFLGGLRSGAVPVPLSTMLTANELAAIIDDSGAGVVVVSASFAPYLRTIVDQSRELRAAVVIGDGDGGDDVAVPVHAWTSFTDDAEARVAPTKA